MLALYWYICFFFGIEVQGCAQWSCDQFMKCVKKFSASNGARAMARSYFCDFLKFLIFEVHSSFQILLLNIFYGLKTQGNTKFWMRLPSYFDPMHFWAIFRFLMKFEFSWFLENYANFYEKLKNEQFRYKNVAELKKIDFFESL